MKKLSLILAAVMLLAMFVPAVSITSVAADATYEAEVTDAAGSTTQYKTVAEAVAAATDGSTVKVIAEEVIVDNPLRVYGNNVTFDGGNALFKFTPSEDGKALFEVAGGYADDGAKGNLYYTGYGDAIANLEVGKVTIKNVNFEPTLDIALGGGKSFVVDVYNNVEVTLDAVYGECLSACNVTATKGANSIVNILGGSYVSNFKDSCPINVSNGTVLNIYGGYFLIKLPGDDQGRCVAARGEGTVVNVYGGIFVSNTYKDCICPRGSAVANIYGGTYIQDYPKAGEECVRYGYDGGTVNLVFATYVTNELSSDDNKGVSANTKKIEYVCLSGSTLYAAYQKTIPTTKLASTNVAFKGEQGSGIRFNSTVAADLIAYANEKKDFGTELKYGTVITAADYLDCANQDDYTVSPEELTRRGLAYQDVAAVNGITDNADGSVSFNAVLAGITGKNANRDFAAVAYVEYVKDGHAVRVYGLYDAATGSANMADLAVAALADVSLTESATHMYKTADGKYSPYTAEQQAVLAVYAGLDK